MTGLQLLAEWTPVIVTGTFVAIILIGLYFVYNRIQSRTPRLLQNHGAEEEAFERDMMRQFGAGKTAGVSVMPPMPPSLPASTPPGAPQRTAEPPGRGYDSLPEFTRRVAQRLSAAGIAEGVDGPLRSRNPEIVGTILRARGNKKLAVIESGWKTPDPDLEMVLTLLDGAIISGPGEEPIFVQRLQTHIGDSIRL